MSRQRDANHELSSRSQLMTLFSAKFPCMREGVASGHGISAKTRRRGREGEGRDGKTHLVPRSYPNLVPI